MSEQQIFCPQCGQRVELSTEYKTSFCPYCGSDFSFLDSDSNVPPVPPAENFHAEKPERILEKEIPASPVKRQSPPVPPKRKGWRPTLGRWYLAVAVWAVTFAGLYILGEETDMLDQPTILLPLIFLASFPIWYPSTHPWRHIPEKRKGTWLRWTLIMALILAAIFFLLEEIL